MKARVLLTLVALAACEQAPVTTAPPPSRLEKVNAPPASDYATNEGTTVYWRTSLEPTPANAQLWVYRNEPELGMSAHEPYSVGNHHPTLGIRLARLAIYWDWPIAAALDSLENFIAAVPDSTTLLINVHSEHVCVGQNASSSERATKYQEYATYVSTLAAAAPRTGRVRVLYWQLFNEMNAGWTNLFGGNSAACAGDGASQYLQGQRYGTMLSYAYPAIKNATNGEAFVVMGGLSILDGLPMQPGANGRYGFVDGMYSTEARANYDVAAIQNYGDPGIIAMRRGADFDSVLVQYGDANRPMFMTEFGSLPYMNDAQMWSTWSGVIDATKAAKSYTKIMGYVLCGGEPQSITGNGCGSLTTTYNELASRQYNATMFATPTIYTDVVIRRPREGVVPTGYSYVDEGVQFRIQNVPVNYRVPTVIRFTTTSSVGAPRLDVDYRVFVHEYGWTDWGSDSIAVGTTGIARSMNAIQVRLKNSLSQERVRYAVYQNGSWKPWVTDGAISGDTSIKAEAFRAEVYRSDAMNPNVTICYYAHVTVEGWLDEYPRCDGAYTGWSLGSTWRMEAMRIWVTRTGPAPGSLGGSVSISGSSHVRPGYVCTWWASPSFTPTNVQWYADGQPVGTNSTELTYHVPSSSFQLSVQASDNLGHLASSAMYVNVSSSAQECLF